ncbi:MAG: hypothetical protein ABSB89_08580 [Candidatus Bathyarchaeia archaeon]
MTKFPFKDAEQKKRYNQIYRENQRELREEARIEMLRTVNETIAEHNPTDINSLLQLDTDLRFYKTYGDFKRDHPDAQFSEFLTYQSDEKEWLFERQSERVLAVQRALVFLDGSEPKMRIWREMFPRFFEKYEHKIEVLQS